MNRDEWTLNNSLYRLYGGKISVEWKKCIRYSDSHTDNKTFGSVQWLIILCNICDVFLPWKVKDIYWVGIRERERESSSFKIVCLRNSPPKILHLPCKRSLLWKIEESIPKWCIPISDQRHDHPPGRDIDGMCKATVSKIQMWRQHSELSVRRENLMIQRGHE